MQTQYIYITFQSSSLSPPCIRKSVIIQGALRLIWSGRLESVFVDPKGAKISKNGNKITCRLSKNKHFLFYTPGRGGNIMPATPS